MSRLSDIENPFEDEPRRGRRRRSTDPDYREEVRTRAPRRRRRWPWV